MAPPPTEGVSRYDHYVVFFVVIQSVVFLWICIGYSFLGLGGGQFFQFGPPVFCFGHEINDSATYYCLLFYVILEEILRQGNIQLVTPWIDRHLNEPAPVLPVNQHFLWWASTCVSASDTIRLITQLQILQSQVTFLIAIIVTDTAIRYVKIWVSLIDKQVWYCGHPTASLPASIHQLLFPHPLSVRRQ